MSVKVKTPQELETMTKAGKILAEIMAKIVADVKPGITTLELDAKAEALCQEYQVIPAFKGYNGFPGTLCTGVNDVAVHGIPNQYEVLSEGQIISLDMGIKYKGYFSDHAVTLPVGKIDPQGIKLLETTRLCLRRAVEIAKDGSTTGDIGYIIEQIANLAGFSPIEVMVGHGIGQNLHEDPEVPCFGRKGEGTRLKEGMVIAIEAMINEGEPDLYIEDDGWTTRTRDGKRSAIFEHSVQIGRNAGIILTIK